jgi:AcrR family transcriptional regulator
MARLGTDERRSQLLELGLRLFSERSYEDVAIDDIAAEAGISKGLLYHYFGGKRSFYVATVELAAARLVEQLDSGEAEESERAVREGLRRYLAYVDQRAVAYRALMHGGLGSDAEVQAIVEGARVAIASLMLEGLGLDEPRAMFRMAVRSWLGGVEAACLDWLGHRDLDSEQLVEFHLAVLRMHLATALSLDPAAPIDLEKLNG